MSPIGRDRPAVRETVEPPSGVHRRCGRVLVIEPDRGARGQWNVTAEVHHLEFVKDPTTLPRALRRPGAPQAISVALMERTALECRAALVAGLNDVVGLNEQRVIIDVRRCDLATALALLGAGFILCADDESHRGSAPRAAVNHATMADELSDSEARTRLVKTVGASAISDRHDLSAGEHRVLRGLMDSDHLKPLAARAALSPSTIRSHAFRIRKKVGAAAMSDVVRAAEQVAFDAAFALGQLRL